MLVNVVLRTYRLRNRAVDRDRRGVKQSPDVIGRLSEPCNGDRTAKGRPQVNLERLGREAVVVDRERVRVARWDEKAESMSPGSRQWAPLRRAMPTHDTRSTLHADIEARGATKSATGAGSVLAPRHLPARQREDDEVARGNQTSPVGP